MNGIQMFFKTALMVKFFDNLKIYVLVFKYLILVYGWCRQFQFTVS